MIICSWLSITVNITLPQKGRRSLQAEDMGFEEASNLLVVHLEKTFRDKEVVT